MRLGRDHLIPAGILRIAPADHELDVGNARSQRDEQIDRALSPAGRGRRAQEHHARAVAGGEDLHDLGRPRRVRIGAEARDVHAVVDQLDRPAETCVQPHAIERRVRHHDSSARDQLHALLHRPQAREPGACTTRVERVVLAARQQLGTAHQVASGADRPEAVHVEHDGKLAQDLDHARAEGPGARDVQHVGMIRERSAERGLEVLGPREVHLHAG